MPRKRNIDRLPRAIRDELERILRDGGCTIDQVVEHLRQLGAPIPRSTVGRYVKDFEQNLKRYREAQEVAGKWVSQLGENPRGNVGRLLSELLKTVAFQQIAPLGEEGAEVTPMDLMLLASAIQKLGSFDKMSAELELRVRKEMAQKVDAAIADEKKRGGGLSEDAAARIRTALVGEIAA
jgi:hypothetical protein